MNIQEKIEDWWSDAEEYDLYIKQEFQDDRFRAWKELFTEHLGGKTNLRILDIGTGSGFFASVLADMGNEVIGIDCSDAMLERARRNAVQLNVNPRFYKMDAHHTFFEEMSFDWIVSRNVTWTLHRPKEAYMHWKKLLKPGGRLLIFDANWHRQFYDRETARRVREREEKYFEIYGKEFKVCTEDKAFYDMLPLSNTMRPRWDIDVLQKIGFSHVSVKEDIGSRVYEEWEKELYSESPLFEIEAVNGQGSEPPDGEMRS